jgi:hypothetical protein
MDKEEFKKAWYLAYAAREAGVVAPNWNKLENSHIQEIAETIPAKYWERASTMTSNEAWNVYEKTTRR